MKESVSIKKTYMNMHISVAFYFTLQQINDKPTFEQMIYIQQ